MKPFKMKLAAVATVRQRRENEALQVYAGALLNRSRAIEALQAVERELALAQSDCHREMTRGCHASEMARHSGHCERLNRVRLEGVSRLAEAEREAEIRMRDLLNARREREAVDKYHGRQRLAYDRAVSREDQKALDELAVRLSPFSTAFTSEFTGREESRPSSVEL